MQIVVNKAFSTFIGLSFIAGIIISVIMAFSFLVCFDNTKIGGEWAKIVTVHVVFRPLITIYMRIFVQ